VKSIWSKILAVWLVISNRYEAGQLYRAGRSYLPGYVQDARYDADPATRDELVRKSRYFEQNNGIIQRLADLFEQYTVGPNGLKFIAASSSEEWNERNAAAWDAWCQFPDLTSLQGFATLQSLCARAWFIDGEVFLLKSYGLAAAEPGKPSRRPRLQVIESHRVSTPSTRYTDEGRTIIEGIEVDGRGRPIAYHVRDGLQTDTWRRYDANDVIHLFEPGRPGQYRGLPFLYAVLNDLHDLDDLQMLTAQVARRLASVSDVVYNEAGEEDPDTLRNERWRQTTQTTAGADTTQDRVSYYKQHLGATTKYLKTGDKIDRANADRPSVAEREYWDYLTSKICAGVGISKLLVFPWSMQGTVTRADLDVQNAFFRSRSQVLIGAFLQVYLWVTDWHIKNDPELFEKPADWRAVSCRPPRSVNVDVGRNSSALISEYEAGWRTLEGICGEMGDDWRTTLRQRAREMKLAAGLETEFDLAPGSLIAAALEAQKQKKAMQQPAAPVPAPEPEPANA